MATKIITSFFTISGNPTSGLTPTIKIWRLDVGSPMTNTLVVNGEPLSEIGDGWYRFDFTAYNYLENYAIVVDGGISVPLGERYVWAANESFQEDIVNTTWNEPISEHLSAGTTGYALNQAQIDSASAVSLVETLLKYEKNRTRIDKTAKTLTIYDDDGTTPLKVFDLKDGGGTPSITEVCERVPQP